MMKIVSLEEEFRKNPQLKQGDIDHLRRWIDQEKCVPASVSDLQVALFLHCCHYNVEAAKDLMKTNYKWRAENTDYSLNRNPKQSPKLERSLHTVRFVILPRRTDANELIMVLQTIDNTPKDFHFTEILQLLFMLIEVYLLHHGSSNGFVMIMDFEPVTLALSRRYSISGLRTFFTYVQEAIPINVNAMHFVNSNAVLDMLFALSKPFIKSALVHKIHFHRTGTTTILDHLAPSCVPKAFGGEEETSLVQLHEQSLELLQSFKPWFEEEDNALKNFILTKSQKKC